jgi:hypothetical protein
MFPPGYLTSGKEFLQNEIRWPFSGAGCILSQATRYGFMCGMMQKSIFISYRREDSAGHAGRIKDRLEREFGDSCRLFMDVDAIPLGVDFAKHLTEEVATCDVLLAVIGRQWIETRDEAGKRRLDQPNDYVRIEIGAALQRDIPVIPLLLADAKMPRAELLPDDLKALSVRNSLDIHDTSFQSDVDRLVRELKRRFFPEGKEPTPATKQPTDAVRPQRAWLRVLLSFASLAGGAVVGFLGGLFFLTFLAALPLKYLMPGRTDAELDAMAGSIGFLVTAAVAAISIRWLRQMSPYRAAGLIGLYGGAVSIAFVAGSHTKSAPSLTSMGTLAIIAVALFALTALLRRRLF